MYTLRDDMLKYIKSHKRIRPCQIKVHYFLSRTRIHQVLKLLINEGAISKSGRKPKVYYHVVRNRKVSI